MRKLIRKWLLDILEPGILTFNPRTYKPEGMPIAPLEDVMLLLEQFNILNRKVNHLMSEGKSLKDMYEDLQKDIQPVLNRLTQRSKINA